MSKFKLPSKLRNKSFGRQLISLGFYYKDDQDDGFSIDAGVENHAWYGILKKFDEEIRKTFKIEMAAIKRQDAAMQYDIPLAQFQAEVKHNMIVGINEWNILHGYAVRPMRGEPFDVSIGYDTAKDQQKTHALFMIMTGIIYLTEWGLLENDNYNGPSYVYMH